VTIALATTWGWGIGMVVCMLMMGVMMFAMMGHGRASGGWTRWWPERWPESREEKETPLDVLERRFAEGEISVEDYRERREILANGTVTQNGGHKDDALTAPGPGEGRH
jgi:uncharacterized membrane protein